MGEITRRRDAIEAKRLGQLRGHPLSCPISYPLS